MPVYRPRPVLRQVLDALAPQVDGAERELVLVESSGDGTAAELERLYPWIRVVALNSRTPQGEARNIGAGEAWGELLAFIDADAVPAPDWLDRLEAALQRTPGAIAVAGAIENGTPRNPIGTAGFLLEFAEWLPARRGAPEHAATCNFLVRRTTFERLGGFALDVWTGEDTLFSTALREQGELAFARDARVRHMNRTALAGLLRDQHKHGVGIVEISRRVPFQHGWANRPALAPVALAVKVLGVIRVCAGSGELERLALVSPFALAALAAWVAGLVRSGRYTYPRLPYPGGGA